MVRVAVAGGSGSVAREVIDHILAKQKHEVVSLTRKTITDSTDDGIKWVQVDYGDQKSLVEALRGVDVVLCFFSGADAKGAIHAQKCLIDASITAGVKRFAPTEWATRSNSSFGSYAFKDVVRKYLEKVNEKKTVLEYTLFQPGLFTNYFGFPHATTRRYKMNQLFVDFENRRALCAGNGDYTLTLTTLEDMAAVVAEALDFKDTWPVVGGMRGSQISLSTLIELGKELRGTMTVENLALSDLENGQLKASWYPIIEHPSIPSDLAHVVSQKTTIDFLKSAADESWKVSDEWNKLLPGYRFTDAREYLSKVWQGKQ